MRVMPALIAALALAACGGEPERDPNGVAAAGANEATAIGEAEEMLENEVLESPEPEAD